MLRKKYTPLLSIILIPIMVFVLSSCGNGSTAAPMASREKAQYFLDNADTVWFEEYPVIMYGHELIPTAKFTVPVLPDAPVQTPDPTDAMLDSSMQQIYRNMRKQKREQVPENM